MGGGRRWEVGLKNRWDLGLVRGVHSKLPHSFSVIAHYSCDWADEERESIKQTNPSIISWWTPKILHLLA